MTDEKNIVELREEFLQELKAFLRRWNAEIEAEATPFGYLSLRYFVAKNDQYFHGHLPHVFNADTRME